ncbi:MAG: M48 family metallopeptidase [Myxococcota bacterium]
MKFVPPDASPEINHNVSPEHPLKEALTLVVGAAVLIVGLTMLLVFAIDRFVDWLPPETETRLLQTDWSTSDEEGPEQARLQVMVDQLAEGWPENPYTFRVSIWPSEVPNAFALPGGVIGVTRGLLDEVTSENEIAFVLAHEIGHFKNRDHLRGLGRGLAIGLAWAWLTSSGASLDVGNLISQVTQRSFAREQESEADEVGLRLLVAEYGHAGGATKFFERRAADEDSADAVALPFSTHPLSDERVDALRARAAELNVEIDGELTPWSPTTESPSEVRDDQD